jgi:citrate synthase
VLNSDSKGKRLCQDPRVTDDNREYFGVCNVFVRDPLVVNDANSCKNGDLEQPMSEEEFSTAQKLKDARLEWEANAKLQKANLLREAQGLPINRGPMPVACKIVNSLTAADAKLKLALASSDSDSDSDSPSTLSTEEEPVVAAAIWRGFSLKQNDSISNDSSSSMSAETTVHSANATDPSTKPECIEWQQ